MTSGLESVALLVLLLSAQSSGEETFEQAYERAWIALNAKRLDECTLALQKCLEMRNDPGVAELLADCSSLNGNTDLAIDSLSKAIEWGGFPNLAEPDLDSLRADQRFQRLAASARSPATGTLPLTYVDWTGGHRTNVAWAKFSPDGRKVLTSSIDGWVRIWDSDSGELLLSLLAGNPIGWLDSGRTIFTRQWGVLRLRDARTGELVRSLGTTVQGYFDVSPDGRLFLSAEKGASLVNLQSGREDYLLRGSTVYGVAFAADGKRFALGLRDGSVRLFDAESLECLGTHSCVSPVFDVAFSPDGRYLVAGGADGALRWLDAQTLELTRSVRAHEAEINGVVFRPGGAEFLTTSVDRVARVWNTMSGSLRLTLTGHTGESQLGDYSPDGKRIVTPCADGKVRVWDADSGDLVLTLGGRRTLGHRTVAFSPDSARLVTFDKGGAREWDVGSGHEQPLDGTCLALRLRNGQGNEPTSVTFHTLIWNGDAATCEIEGARVGVDAAFLSHDRRIVYTADADDHGRLWEATSGKMLRDLGPLSREPELTTASSRWVSACFSPDGRLVATAQHADGAAHLWESLTGDEVAAFRGGGVWAGAVAFDSAGEQLAVTRYDWTLDVWNIVTGERVYWGKGPSWAKHLTFRSDGRVLAAGYHDGTVRLWDLPSGACLKVLRMLFPVAVLSVAFSPDGRKIAAAANDHRVFLWDAEHGSLLGTIVPGDEQGDWLAFAPSGHYHGTPASISSARFVQDAISYPLTCFAPALESPDRVAASFAGQEIELPRFPTPPSLVVAAPREHTSTASERVVHIQALATEALAGLAGIEVSQDGVAIPAEILAEVTQLEDNERLARLDLRLPIPAGAAETRITLQAVSARGIKSRPASFVVRYEPPKQELYVLALGVADYADDKLDLACPVQDVDGLVQRFQGQEELFHAVRIERRVDREVTPAEVLRLREEFLLQAKPDDTLVVFVAGHGVRTDSGEYWFLTSDATPQRPYSGIKRADLESLVTWDKLHATKRVLLLDTCHSGAAFGQGTRGERGIAFQQSEVDTLLERSSGLYILAATSDDGFAREQEGNGLFTRALLDGLEGAADSGDFGDHDGTVGIDELMHFARYAVLERSEGRQRPTFPKIEGGENFPLARVGAASAR